MGMYVCLVCRQCVTGIMRRTHLVTEHAVSARELLEKRMDVDAVFQAVRP